MIKAGHTRSVQAVQHAQDDVQGLHQIHSVAAGLIGKVEVLQQPPNHRQQARLLHVIMQKPASKCLIPSDTSGTTDNPFCCPSSFAHRSVVQQVLMTLNDDKTAS